MEQNGFSSLVGSEPVAGGTSTSNNSFGSYPSFGQSQNSTTQQLYDTALQQGGAVSQAAQELVHPTTGILSTIGGVLKNSFSDFVNFISLPSEVVAGVLSSKYNISQAIAKGLRPSDVIFGKEGSNLSTMQKIGDFVVRTATDILLDPVTYLGFGEAASFFGIRAFSKVAIGDTVKTLSKSGMENLGYLKRIQRQALGLQSALTAGGEVAAKMIPDRLKLFQEIKALETGGTISKEVMTMGKSELKKMMNETIDAPLNEKFAQLVLGKVLEASPALTETLIDKGGIKYFGKTILSAQRISSVAALIPGLTWLDRVTQPTRMMVGSLFNPAIEGYKDIGGKSTFVRMPPEFMASIKSAEDLTRYLKDSRIKNMRAIMKANGIDPNMDGQFFTAAVENGVMPTDPKLANAYKQLLGYNNNEINYLREMGVPITKLDNHVPHILVDSKIKVLPFKLPPSTKIGGAIHRVLEGGIFKADKEQMAQWESAVLNKDKKGIEDIVKQTKKDGFEIFDDNFFKASIARSLDNVRSGTMKQFVDGLAGNFAKQVKDAPPGWVGIHVGQYGKEADFMIRNGMAESSLVFHPAIAKKIEDFTASVYGDLGTHEMLKMFDRLQNTWKASVTSIFLAFHGRNAISNVLLNFNDIGLHAFSPQINGLSLQMLHNDAQINGLLVKAFKAGQEGEDAKTAISDILQKKLFTDVHGYDWTFGELRSIIKKNNIALMDNIVGQVDVARNSEDMINAIMAKGFLKGAYKDFINPFSQNFKPFVMGRKVGNWVEGQARMVNFITNLKKTGDVQLATARTNMFLFDYQNLTSFERGVMRRVIPFYSFTRKNLEAQVRTFLTTPGRTAAQLTTLLNLGDAISGKKLTKQQESLLPDWVKQGVSILAQKQGQNVTVLSSLGTPIEQPFQYFQANQVLSSVSPFIRLPIEQASGYDFFQMKPISDITNATALKHFPDIIKQYVGYTDVSFTEKNGQKVNMQVALHPERLHFILNLPITSRVMSAMKQMQNQKLSGQARLLQQLIGIKPYAFSLQLEQQRRTRELQQKLENILSTAGVGYKLTRFVPKKTQN